VRPLGRFEPPPRSLSDFRSLPSTSHMAGVRQAGGVDLLRAATAILLSALARARGLISAGVSLDHPGPILFLINPRRSMVARRSACLKFLRTMLRGARTRLSPPIGASNVPTFAIFSNPSSTTAAQEAPRSCALEPRPSWPSAREHSPRRAKCRSSPALRFLFASRSRTTRAPTFRRLA